MVESNYAALGQGLKLYTDAMRRFVREKLIAVYPSRWWEDGVLKHLNDAQRGNLRRDIERNPQKDKLDFLDAPHFVPIVTKEFDRAFAGVFGDFNKTRSWLQQAAAARLEHAHPRSGDLPADDVAHSLYSMVQVLRAAGQPEADEVEEIRRAVLKIEEEPAAPARAASSTRQAAPGQLPYWWQVCEPHDAFQDPATIDESLFAATLGGVHAGAARDEYLRPESFLSHTYFTENLKQTIRDVASRLNGGEGPSVTELQTPFGGGKTHALLTLYHLIKNPEASLAVPGVREALAGVEIPTNARVLVFDGQEWGTEPVEKENGASVSTLWGELAFQIDPMVYHRHVMEADGRGEAPGNAIFRNVLEEASPCLILIDEL
ncbi:MAG TPA: Swt1 family HEPN domain-containing protein, partial [Dehalococcoidia bacterium]|nr:Swt1 family HEPN domain-containing protein [Dehalococcoidia bacterium]